MNQSDGVLNCFNNDNNHMKSQKKNTDRSLRVQAEKQESDSIDNRLPRVSSFDDVYSNLNKCPRFVHVLNECK